MAKKKVQQEKDGNQASMDSSVENLKSLNQMLVKEAFERRQQVDSLLQSKASLETELTRSITDKEALHSELTHLGDTASMLELQRSVVAVFVAVQLKMGLEMELNRLIDSKESEIGRLNGELTVIQGALGVEREVSKTACRERDEIKDRLHLQIEEGDKLRANFEERKRAVERELAELRVVYNAVVGEKEEREMRIQSMTRDKDSLERSLVESNHLIEEMEGKLCGVVREKELIELEKNAEIVKTQELENAVNGLNQMVVDLRKEEVKLGGILAKLETKCFEGEEMQKEARREIDRLVEEKKLSEKKIESLAADKTAVKMNFSEAMKQLAEKNHKIEEMVNENVVILEAKSRLDGELVELRNQVAELKVVVLELEESNRAQVDRIKSLESEASEYRFKLEQVEKEKDEMETYLDEEKQNAVRLKENIRVLENNIEESLKVSGKLEADNVAIFAEKVELESQCEMLKKEITCLENTITEVRNGFDLLKGKVEVADANSDQVLNLLKKTAAFCSKDDESDDVMVAGDFLGSGEESKAYVVELEMIKNAFESKVGKIDEMKKQLELLQSCVEDAHKKKSFWTLLSSATTLLAALSLAYVARGH